METNTAPQAQNKPETVKTSTSGNEQQQQRSSRPRFSSNDRRGGRFSRDRRGRGPRRPKDYNEAVIHIKRVAKTVKGGKRIKFTALVAVGDGKGNVGFALGKANEVPDAIKKALEAAKKNMFRVPVAKGDTIPHEITGIYGASKVFLKPAPEGTGVIAGGSVRAIMGLAGIKNIYSKIYGSRTAINAVRATCNGLKALKTPAKIAANRGKTVEELKQRVAPEVRKNETK